MEVNLQRRDFSDLAHRHGYKIEKCKEHKNTVDYTILKDGVIANFTLHTKRFESGVMQFGMFENYFQRIRKNK